MKTIEGKVVLLGSQGKLLLFSDERKSENAEKIKRTMCAKRGGLVIVDDSLYDT